VEEVLRKVFGLDFCHAPFFSLPFLILDGISTDRHKIGLLKFGLAIIVLLIIGFYLPFVEIELSSDFIRESFHVVESSFDMFIKLILKENKSHFESNLFLKY
jgi:hypothetical protein